MTPLLHESLSLAAVRAERRQRRISFALAWLCLAAWVLSTIYLLRQ